MTTEEVDVLIVGAGATGLSAAYALQRAGKAVLVLESRYRVGGRLWTDDVDGIDLEIGGQWVSPDQDALLAMLDELDVQTFARHREGESVYIGLDGERRPFVGEQLPVASGVEKAMGHLADLLDDLSAQMDPSRPWAMPAARELDQVTFLDWLGQNCDEPEARDNIGMFIAQAMLTKPAHTFSALQAVHMAASAGSCSNLVDSEFILDKRVIGGLQQVPLRLAERLGAAVRTGLDVEKVVWTDSGVVASSGDLTVVAQHLVLAIPPTAVTRVRFEPPLPSIQRETRQHQSFGQVIKVHASYETQFWRDAGLSGTAFRPLRRRARGLRGNQLKIGAPPGGTPLIYRGVTGSNEACFRAQNVESACPERESIRFKSPSDTGQADPDLHNVRNPDLRVSLHPTVPGNSRIGSQGSGTAMPRDSTGHRKVIRNDAHWSRTVR